MTFFEDLRFALRQLVKAPGFALTAIVTLALGIGANTAMFTVDYAAMVAPLPYPKPDQLVIVWSSVKGHRNSVSPLIPAAQQPAPRSVPP